MNLIVFLAKGSVHQQTYQVSVYRIENGFKINKAKKVELKSKNEFTTSLRQLHPTLSLMEVKHKQDFKSV